MPSQRKYAVHPGIVYSKQDGDRHFITAAMLARLYELRSNEYVAWTDDSPRQGLKWENYIHLYPSYEGNYGRPKED